MKHLLFILVFILGCSTYNHKKNIINDDYKIISKILEKENAEVIYSNSFYYFTPEVFFKRYTNNMVSILNKKNDSLFTVLNGNIEWIFSKSDIDFLTKKHQKWRDEVWDKNRVDKSITFYKEKRLPIKTDKTIYKISYPMYDKTEKKAMVIQIKHGGWQDTFIQILLFKKEHNEWINVGSLFSGVY